ncbi:hypothetical protein [Halalkalicoccus jeotgali]|uniref:Uncharacterized protein n=1 Tax=Halalkalicoccus jeotgali (strain DSM 18796 / CECT 7217 / JCM 14584 / KCTC 4019 / B3) TaxID=795797 RepID=D8JDB3_HALJB|nr:hypothetical protein [Halalkalicoccus jeotgali]ADJ17265.1 hypothetical protein HacjB3_19653 [Halalkalicoccus jeotgali B3]ELY32578.1 hypothetical protein C497_19404 [Halalkalicoccus jeotgali B3]
MNVINNYAWFPGPMEREQYWLENIYYVVRIVYVVILIAGTLSVLGGV